MTPPQFQTGALVTPVNGSSDHGRAGRVVEIDREHIVPQYVVRFDDGVRQRFREFELRPLDPRKHSLPTP